MAAVVISCLQKEEKEETNYVNEQFLNTRNGNILIAFLDLSLYSHQRVETSFQKNDFLRMCLCVR